MTTDSGDEYHPGGTDWVPRPAYDAACKHLTLTASAATGLLELLRAAQPHLGHVAWCASVPIWRGSEGRPCDCGLDALAARIAAAVGEASDG